MDNVLGSNDALSLVVTGLGVATVAAGVVVVVCAVFVVAERVRNHRSAPPGPASTWQAAPTVGPTGPPMSDVSPASAQGARPALPVGAEAALQAIVELEGDPRNVVVTHRDPTGEIRLYPLPTGNPDTAAPPDLARSA